MSAERCEGEETGSSQSTGHLQMVPAEFLASSPTSIQLSMVYKFYNYFGTREVDLKSIFCISGDTLTFKLLSVSLSKCFI
jgi:hypothetical protein